MPVGTATGKIEPVPCALVMAEPIAWSVPAAVPVVVTSPVLPFFWLLVKPKRAPRLREKSLFTMTMRASMSTWRTGMSSVATRRRTSASRSAVSCSSRVLVRSSTATLPRGDSSELLWVLMSPAMSWALA